MLSNLASLLNSLDNIAQENLEVPKISATVLRQSKKETDGSSNSNLLHSFLEGSSTVTPSIRSNNSETSFEVIDQDNQSDNNSLSPNSSISSSSFNNYAIGTAPILTSTSSTPGNSSRVMSHTTSNTNIYSVENQFGKHGTSKHDLSVDVSNLSSSSLTNSSDNHKDVKQIIVKKNKEIEKLNAECLELENQNEGLKQEVREAWEAYKTSQEKAALREAEYQEDMRLLERAKSSDREGMTIHVQDMERELKEKRVEVSTLRLEHDRVTAKLQALEEEAKDWMSRRDSLEASLEVAQANNNQSLQGLREELRSKEVYIETLQAEHSNVMRQTHKRQEAMERANADLASSLMTKERELARITQQQNHQAAGRDSGLQGELSKLRNQCEQMSGSLQEEQAQHLSCQKRLRSCEHEAEISKSSWEEEKLLLLNRISQLSSELSASSGSLHPSSPAGKGGNGGGGDALHEKSEEIKRLEEQLRTLGKQLLRKQESLEEFLSERAALKVRLQDSERRCKKAEDQVVSLLDSYADPYDFEDSVGTSASLSQRHESGNLRKRSGISPQSSGGGGGGPGASRPIRASQDLEKLGVHAGSGVTKAVDMIDTWTLVTGRFLKSYPLLRVCFVLYLLIIHLWAFAILAYHTHALDLANENANALTYNKFESNQQINS